MATTIHLREPHEKQAPFVFDDFMRKIVRTGRRGGKTVGASLIALIAFLEGRRVLYAAPTLEQVEKFWFEVCLALAEPITSGVYYKNDGRHIIEVKGTENRIRAKTAWNANTLRGDYADMLILDEWQLMDRDAWGLVGAPMLMDNNGRAVFIYTTRRGKKGEHARDMFKGAEEDDTGRWMAYNWTSHDNPHISQEAVEEIAQDMTRLAYEAEILALEKNDDPRALWNRGIINHTSDAPHMERLVVGCDPPGTEEGAECGIVVAGRSNGRYYVMDDRSLRGSPAGWGGATVAAYHVHEADRIIAEVNHGGDMVEHTLRTVEGGDRASIEKVRASRGKHTRAEPIAALYERGLVEHVGEFRELEDQMCSWVPGDDSPDRIDALVWALSALREQGARLGKVRMRYG